MSKAYQILIVEDDKAFGTVLTKAFKKAKLEAYWAQSPEAAQTLCNHTDFSLIIADCMLPRLDGVSLVESLREQLTTQPDVLLMTGVFKDKQFHTEALRKTQAQDILIKPFDLDTLIDRVSQLKNAYFDQPSHKKSVTEIFCQRSCDLPSLVTAFEDWQSLSGREAALVLSMLVEKEWTGVLHLELPDQRIGHIDLQQGQICHVTLTDEASRLGHLLMDLGFVEPEELQTALSSLESGLIGQKLIKQLALSPHALELALSEQSALRLSRMIIASLVRLKIEIGSQEIDQKKQKPIAKKRLHQLYREWGASKFGQEGLEELFTTALDQKIQIINSKLFTVYPNSITLRNFIKDNSIESAVEALLRRQALPLIAYEESSNYEQRKEKWLKLDESLKGKSHFQILGLSQNAVNQEIERAYLGLKRTFESNQMTTDEELKKILRSIETRVEKAYQVLIDDTLRQAYLAELDLQFQQQLLSNQPDYDFAVSMIEKGEFSEAYKILQRLASQKLLFPDLTSYLIIAKAKAQKETITESDLQKVAPENRQSGAYLFAKGLHLKMFKNHLMAIQYFRKSLVYNPSSQIARKEIASCLKRLKQENKPSSLFSHLKDGIWGSGKIKGKKAS